MRCREGVIRLTRNRRQSSMVPTYGRAFELAEDLPAAPGDENIADSKNYDRALTCARRQLTGAADERIRMVEPVRSKLIALPYYI